MLNGICFNTNGKPGLLCRARTGAHRNRQQRQKLPFAAASHSTRATKSHRTAMKRRAGHGHNMLIISQLALALPRATAFTTFRRRLQPRVVLRGTGTEQLGAVAAPGVRVRAPWRD